MRRHAVGAEITAEGTSFRLWAPGRRRITLHVGGRDLEMSSESEGYFTATVDAPHGERYGFKLDGGADIYADPASRSQPDGPHGLSAVVAPSRYAWRHDRWDLASRGEHVLYEMHTGTFTAEGTWKAAAARLPLLSDIGVTAIEMMPVAEFPGAFGWGYDGVQWFAPYHGYGTPDDLRAFVDAAHGLGLGVILDVVYNHFGPDGNYQHLFAPPFLSSKDTEWGKALNFDGPHSEGVRAFVIANARYWIEEFRFDGLRLDAVQQIFDDSPESIVAALTREARDAAGGRPILIIGEDEPQDARLVRGREAGGAGLDALWNDDFHHAAVVALTGDRSAYYSDYEGSARELVSCARHGFLFQGQRYAWQDDLRGLPALDIPPDRFVCCLENHDQVANSADGRRLHQRAAPGAMRAMTALLLLGPWTPMLFQGQEFGSTAPFLFFADHKPELARKVADGRREFLQQFPRFRDPAVSASLPAPDARETFTRSTLDDAERESNTAWTSLHRDLIRLRRSDPVLASARHAPDGSALDATRLLLRYGGADRAARLIVVNLGAAFDLATVSDPLVAPPSRRGWRIVWHSEQPTYGGSGIAPLEPQRWWMPARSTVVLGEV